jgi:Reverse transcriptase (RNA-dependent DNA polymerase)
VGHGTTDLVPCLFSSPEVIPNVPEETFEGNVDSPEEVQEEEEEPEEENEVQLRRSSRIRKQPQRLSYEKQGIPTVEERKKEVAESNHACCFHVVTTEPESWQHAMDNSDNALWKEAIEKELGSLKKNGTYHEVELPKGKKALKHKWVFKIKTKLDGSPKYKARLVIKGFLQKEGVDYSETFALVVKYNSLRLLLGIANQRNMEVHQMDVTTIVLYGDLQKEIYMVPPEGLKTEGKVWKLEKSLYGLKQAPRCWNRKIDEFLTSEGFRRNQTDHAT